MTHVQSLVFAVGPQEIKNFRMIERHYFRDKILHSYDFTFGFCVCVCVLINHTCLTKLAPVDSKQCKYLGEHLLSKLLCLFTNQLRTHHCLQRFHH
jgi:hypothetical protein